MPITHKLAASSDEKSLTQKIEAWKLVFMVVFMMPLHYHVLARCDILGGFKTRRKKLENIPSKDMQPSQVIELFWAYEK